MDMIDVDTLNGADKLKPTLRVSDNPIEKLSDEQLKDMMDDLQNPIKAQKELAVKVKISLDARIKLEMDTKGTLSDTTRRWVESFNSILEKLQKSIHGDKSVNLHLHKVSHGDIAARIRELK